MFADSSFYEDAEQKYPTIEQQINMARQVAHLLTSPSGPSGRGQQMFLKRQQMSTQWKPEPGTGFRRYVFMFHGCSTLQYISRES